MAATATASLYLFLILSLFDCPYCVKSTGIPLTRIDILNSFHYKVVRHDSVNQPSAPAAIVTVPATNPVGVTPNPNPPVSQGANPISPATPVTTPASPGAQPVTNPVTTPTPSLPLTPPSTTTTPIPTPSTTTNAPGGQSWCVAKSGLSETSLQTALNYACGVGGADCSAIQQGGSCYNPSTLQNHASFAFNSYYQKNPAQTSCDFGGTAIVTNQNPSTGSCVYPTSSASGTPSTMPTTPPSNGATVPTTGAGAPPNALNSSTNYPPLGGTSTGGGTIGASPPTDGSYISLSNHLQAAVGSIALVTFITTALLVSPLRHDHGHKLLH